MNRNVVILTGAALAASASMVGVMERAGYAERPRISNLYKAPKIKKKKKRASNLRS